MSQNVLYCCADCLVFARFQGDGARLRLNAFKVVEGRFIEPSAMAAGINALNLAKRFRKDVQLVVGDLTVLSKVLSVPVVATGAQESIVVAEAARAFPFPLSAVVWGWTLQESDGVEQIVRLQASRREPVERLCAVLDTAGCEPAHLFAISEVLALALRNQPPEEWSASLHVESTVTHLAAVYRSRPLLRSIVLSVSAMNNPQEMVKLAATVRRFLAEFHQQIPAGIMARIYVSGIEVKGLEAVLEKELALSVGSLYPEFEISEEVDKALVEGMRPRLLPLIQVAVAALTTPRNSIDLLPPALRQRTLNKRNARRWWAVAAMVALSGSALLIGAWFDLQGAQRQADRWTTTVEPVALLHAQIQSELKDLNTLRTRHKLLDDLVQDRKAWIRFLGDLQNRLVAVEDVWIDALQVIPPPGEDAGVTDAGANALQLNVSGRMVDRENPLARVSEPMQERAIHLLARLAESPFISAVGGTRFDTRESGMLRFSCRLTINPDHFP